MWGTKFLTFSGIVIKRTLNTSWNFSKIFLGCFLPYKAEKKRTREKVLQATGSMCRRSPARAICMWLQEQQTDCHQAACGEGLPYRRNGWHLGARCLYVRLSSTLLTYEYVDLLMHTVSLWRYGSLQSPLNRWRNEGTDRTSWQWHHCEVMKLGCKSGVHSLND